MPVRAGRLRDRLRQRGQARRADAGGGAHAADRRSTEAFAERARRGGAARARCRPRAGGDPFPLRLSRRAGRRGAGRAARSGARRAARARARPGCARRCARGRAAWAPARTAPAFERRGRRCRRGGRCARRPRRAGAAGGARRPGPRRPPCARRARRPRRRRDVAMAPAHRRPPVPHRLSPRADPVLVRAAAARPRRPPGRAELRPRVRPAAQRAPARQRRRRPRDRPTRSRRADLARSSAPFARMRVPVASGGMEFEREEEEAAAEEASHIGGEPYSHEPGEEGDPVDYTEVDGRPAGQTAESWRAVEEGGGGESEGFELAEAGADRARRERPRPVADRRRRAATTRRPPRSTRVRRGRREQTSRTSRARPTAEPRATRISRAVLGECRNGSSGPLKASIPVRVRAPQSASGDRTSVRSWRAVRGIQASRRGRHRRLAELRRVAARLGMCPSRRGHARSCASTLKRCGESRPVTSIGMRVRGAPARRSARCERCSSSTRRITAATSRGACSPRASSGRSARLCGQGDRGWGGR